MRIAMKFRPKIYVELRTNWEAVSDMTRPSTRSNVGDTRIEFYTWIHTWIIFFGCSLVRFKIEFQCSPIFFLLFLLLFYLMFLSERVLNWSAKLCCSLSYLLHFTLIHQILNGFMQIFYFHLTPNFQRTFTSLQAQKTNEIAKQVLCFFTSSLSST